MNILKSSMAEVGKDAQAMDVLVEDVHSLDEALSSEAFKIIPIMPPEPIVTRCAKLLRENEDMRVRRKSIRALSSLGKDALPFLLAEMKGDNPWYLIRNLILVAAEQGEDARDVILGFAGHSDARIRKVVFQSILKFTDDRSRHALMDGLKDPDISIRRLIINFMGGRGETRIVDPLLAMLDDKDQQADPQYESMICEIFASLGKIKDERAVEPMIRFVNPGGLASLFKKRNEKMVAAAVRGLGDIGDPKAVSILKRLSKDHSQAISRAAVEALGKIQ